MNYLIDTNIISEVRKGERCDRNVAAWFASMDDADIYLSVLVVGEIRKGVERARASNPAQARALEKWLTTVIASFGERILAIDQAVADEWGRMAAKRPVSTVDALLAATAKVHGMRLATRNVADVADLGADYVNPFEYRG
ncbi:MAG TPA: type II toxin-antitoxin system VapC family toxin [Pseudolabrys sp.]|nr:type II toxin-antitoxin system VapC family toxin [Pseudolabrys sp.]